MAMGGKHFMIAASGVQSQRLSLCSARPWRKIQSGLTPSELRSLVMRSSGAAAAVAVLILLILPLVYVGSIGPAVWLHDRGMMSPSVTSCAETIYWPLECAGRASPVAERMLMAYVEFWRPGQPPNAVATPAPPLPVPPPTAVAPVASPSAVEAADPEPSN